MNVVYLLLVFAVAISLGLAINDMPQPYNDRFQEWLGF